MKVKQVVIKRIFDAPIRLVFNAWVDPSQMKKWFSPEGMTTPHAESDFRVGGAYAVTMAYLDASTTTVRGIYKEIQNPEKLVFTWKWDGDDWETEVTVRLRAVSKNKTELTLIHAGFKSEETANDQSKQITAAHHEVGWSTALHKLEAILR